MWGSMFLSIRGWGTAFLFLLVSSVGHAQSTTVETETITKRSLSLHLGLTEHDVRYGDPRDFRTNSFDGGALEPLDEDAPESDSVISSYIEESGSAY